MELSEVPETLLWNLYMRAAEARRARTVLADPKAVELVDRIDYPFEETFGAPSPLLAQGHALRVRTFDTAVRAFLDEHPDGTVVTLAEGLETQYWRVDNGRARWLCVELPETAEVRRSLLPDEERRRTLARSALDLSWRDEVDPAHGVLITAQGLLMYLRPTEVKDLIAGCAERFRGGALVFDAVPRWFSARTLRGEMRTAQGYQAPPMPWGMDAGELPKVRTAHPAITDVREVPPPRGRGFYYGALAPVMRWLPAVRNLRPTMTAIARFS
ncbi:class I SAM-dependent methyltransferase [Streptomyces sp. SID8361]|uniref:Class I SAM-dependent methyltransferase n=1 Tax=Streptomyces malaysiensis TaxID=92644 RepID=A0ABX6WKI1_STRMQ|nr:class I SAM-dependent methyltransferase [Streptomyces sp. SID8361]MYX62144.1 class I SAM-dependent methyltransferase [Streptomyces sp. SID8382]QPI61949.1 class I SAM-dependent methyltransferase [Streptomyces solisilvae]